MHPNNIHYDPKTTFININGCEYKGISDFSVEYGSDTYENAVRKSTTVEYPSIPFNNCGEVELTAKVKFNKITFLKLIGLWDWTRKYCPNKRVVHLMNHGKNHKVRYKNFLRALRIIADILNRG